MCSIPVPYDNLKFFQDQLRLEKHQQETLVRHKDIFIEKRHEFAGYFYDYFHSIPETRVVLEHERIPGHLKTVWAHWFETLFKNDFGSVCP